MLRQDVHGFFRHDDAIQLALFYAVQQRRRLNQIIPGQGKYYALGNTIDSVPTATHSLDERGNAFRRGKLHHQVDRADIDSQFHGCGCDQHLQLTGFEPLFRLLPMLLAHAAVMGTDCVVSQALGQSQGQSLREPPGIHEHQRGGMGINQVHQALI